MTSVHIAQCPACGHNELVPFTSVVDHSVSGETFELVRCKDCSLVITQDHPAQEDIGKYVIFWQGCIYFRDLRFI